jgi:hypothetical protein
VSSSRTQLIITQPLVGLETMTKPHLTIDSGLTITQSTGVPRVPDPQAHLNLRWSSTLQEGYPVTKFLGSSYPMRPRVILRWTWLVRTPESTLAIKAEGPYPKQSISLSHPMSTSTALSPPPLSLCFPAWPRRH